jgi:hypothetical protein
MVPCKLLPPWCTRVSGMDFEPCLASTYMWEKNICCIRHKIVCFEFLRSSPNLNYFTQFDNSSFLVRIVWDGKNMFKRNPRKNMWIRGMQETLSARPFGWKLSYPPVILNVIWIRSVPFLQFICSHFHDLPPEQDFQLAMRIRTGGLPLNCKPLSNSWDSWVWFFLWESLNGPLAPSWCKRLVTRAPLGRASQKVPRQGRDVVFFYFYY